MKLCITSDGKDLDSSVEETFGRSPYFVIVDTETLETKSIRNTAMRSGHGAGIGAAQIISDEGAEALLTGIVGPNAFTALKAAHIKVFEGASEFDSIKVALEKFKKGFYKEATVPSGGPGGGRRFRGGRW
ncbi:MAG: NifB/NifX family molybdenum-iron cluster-binding protein [Candidatus Sulfobium sp.]|jgi:predicted Fe-Mo cluster-binding NifX family protein